MAEKFPTLDIITVNWNAGTLLESCLKSIAHADQRGLVLTRVVVVDNGSVDGSVEGLDRFPLPISFIRNRENRGFSAACNQGARGSRADYLLFLNPDVVLTRDSLSRAVARMACHEAGSTGILGIQLLGEDGRVSRTCARFPRPRHFLSHMLGLNRLSSRLFPTHVMLEWDHRENREVDHVMGAFFLIRRPLYEALKGFDERFFVYLEDLDLSFRAHQAGWRSYYLADAKAYHKGGGTSDQIKALRLFYSLRSRILFGYKHFDYLPAMCVLFGTMLIEPFSRLILAISRRSVMQVKETITGYELLWRSMDSILRAARGAKQR